MTRFKIAAHIGFALVASGVAAAAQATIIADWDFGSLAPVAPDNTPAATGGVQAANAASTAQSLGMTNSYSEAGATSSVTYDDITADAASTTGNADVWRIRGSSSATSSTGANGWAESAPEYSQGVQFTTATTNYSNVTLSFNWAATAQGIANLQVQYNLNGNSATGWTNIGSVLNATVGNGAGGNYQTDTVNFGSLANGDADFGVRLVAAYNSTLGSEYAAASSVIAGTPAEYNNTSGNWRFADVQFDGTAVAPVPLPPGVWLLLSGLGALLLVRQRKTTSFAFGA